jgi:methionyl-tRNA synthetase
VWFDALVNYISTLGWGSGDDANFKKFWKNGNPTQYCGKDNLRQQSAMWQAMLLAAGLPNSHQIVINGFFTGDGGIKMSKSIGNVIDPYEVVKEYGAEALRFFVCSEVSMFEDSPFTMERFKDSYNAKLANGIGNLTSRIMKMAETNLESVPPIPENSIPQDWIDAMEKFDIAESMQIVFRHVSQLDELIQAKQPFKLIKTNREEAVEIIKDLVLRLYTIGRMLNPVMPETNRKIKEIVKANKMPSEPLFLRKD